MLINKQFLILLCLISILGLIIPSSKASDLCADTTKEQVSQIASAQFDAWAGKIRTYYLMKGQVEAVGMELTLGTPFQVYTISPYNILSGIIARCDLSLLLEPVGSWLVPVFSQKQQISLLKVDCRDNQLSIVGVIFDSPIAAELNTLNNQLVGVDVEQRWYVQIYQTKHIFLVVERHGNDVIYPLIFPEQYSELEPVDELGGYNPVEVLSTIQAQLPKPENCTVVYRLSDGTLHIPCVTVEEIPGILYETTLKMITQEPLTFGVFELKNNLEKQGGP
ncbi:MAG: hypothetical protein B6247_26040 [Candidatus Parabeggiatoa sp. nov. 2]|nr:MAG: hypothetical protein B6247_26040 [Beggiatoa sp. 4572_84]